MSTTTYNIRQMTLKAAALFALVLPFIAPAASAQETWTPSELKDELEKEFGVDAAIESGVLNIMTSNGETHTYIVEPGRGAIQNERFQTLSTGISKTYGKCSPPILYAAWAGPVYVKWCKHANTSDAYEAKSSYWYYTATGDYIWQGSQLWDCDYQPDYDSMPPPVRIEACQ